MTEDAFLRALFGRLPDPGPDVVVPPGDDCAALRFGPDVLLLLAVDQVVADRHYRTDGAGAATARQVGRKLLARNLSDIAAMGGTPTHCLVAAAVGPQRNDRWLADMLTAVGDMAACAGVHMIGGDLARTPNDEVAALTILGTVPDDQVCTRSGARPGDRLYVTGSFGNSLATGHHLSFEPRCDQGRWLAQHRFATAMIDVSDGLLIDAHRLATASAVSLALDVEAVPGRTPETTRRQALEDGEDYELLLTVPEDQCDTMSRAWPFDHVPITPVGRVEPYAPPRVRAPDGAGLDPRGFDHLAAAEKPDT